MLCMYHSSSVSLIDSVSHEMFGKRFLSFYRSIPSAPKLPFIGSSLYVLRSGGPSKFHLYVDSMHKSLGPIFRQDLGSSSLIFLSHPSEMRKVFSLEGKYPQHFLPQSWILYNDMYNCKRGLFFMEGEEWYNYRKVMNKHLLKNDIVSELSQVYSRVIEDLVNRWSYFSGGVVPHLEHELYRHSISSVMGTLVGSAYVDSYKRFDKSLDRLASVFSKIFETTADLYNIPINIASSLRLPPWNRFVAALTSSLSASKEVVNELMDIRSSDGLLQKLLDDRVPANMVEILVIDLMLAAGDTTAYTTQWALYLLAKESSSVQEELNNDINIRGIMKEALRLYPAAPFITRQLPKSGQLLGYDINEEDLVMLSLYSSGRDDGNYPRAEKFWPGRWARRKEGSLEGVFSPTSFMPFALGTRSCVGAKIAQAHITSTIASILKKFRLELMEDVGLILRPVPVPDKPVKIKITTK